MSYNLLVEDTITLEDQDAVANGCRMLVQGRISWVCPHCGQLNARSVRANEYRVRCCNRLCKRMRTWCMMDTPRGKHAHGAAATLAAAALSL